MKILYFKNIYRDEFNILYTIFYVYILIEKYGQNITCGTIHIFKLDYLK